jgi:GNAT superfamily N-acetyltransferase
LARPSGDIELRAETLTQLRQHVTLPSSFEYRSVFDVTKDASGTALRERPLAEPRFKNYDSLENPLDWLERFDTSRWILIAAYEGEKRVGGVIGAIDTPEVDMLEGRSDLAVLWDVRIAPHRRRQGVGALLFRAVEAWARARGCKELKVETQNINVAACRLYEAEGCRLTEANRHAYADLPDEVQLIWRKALARSRL